MYILMTDEISLDIAASDDQIDNLPFFHKCWEMSYFSWIIGKMY